MRLTASTLVLGALVLLSAAEIAPNSGVRIGLVNDAQAIIGRPFTPLSFAGVARRTAYRGAAYRGAMWGGAAVATAAVATAAVAAAPVYAQPIYAPPVYAQPAYVAPDTGSVPLGTIVSSLPAGCTARHLPGQQPGLRRYHALTQDGAAAAAPSSRHPSRFRSGDPKRLQKALFHCFWPIASVRSTSSAIEM